VSTYDWLLFLHLTGVFLLIGGATVAVILNLAAQGRERPSEVALLFGLVRPAVIAVSAGLLLAIIFGLALVGNLRYASFGDTWVWLSLVLAVLAGFLGDRGGRRDRETRELAQRLSAEGDANTPELRSRLQDPASLAMSYASGVLVLIIVALMIWKPGE
jgi:uncharacterized membrane protein